MKQNGYKNNNETKVKFNRNMKKYHAIGTYQSNHRLYYTWLIRKNDDELDENE